LTERLKSHIKMSAFF